MFDVVATNLEIKNWFVSILSADDECVLVGLICEVNEVCKEDISGEYSCDCKKGYSRVNDTCTG